MDYFGIILVIVDFVSDLTVGIGLFEACHYNWVALSMFFTALPSILVLSFVIIICIFPNIGNEVYVKNVSGLNNLDLIGLILCFPIYFCILTIRGQILKNKQLGGRTLKGLQLLEVLTESVTQFIFTCYIRINLGSGEPRIFGIWIGELIPLWDSRIFSIVTSFCAMLFGFSMISTTNMGTKTIAIVWKDFLINVYCLLLDLPLLFLTITLFTYINGFWYSFGVLIFTWLINSTFLARTLQKCAFECFLLSNYVLIAPFLVIFRGRGYLKINSKVKFMFIIALINYAILASLILINTAICLNQHDTTLIFNNSKPIDEMNCENLCEIHGNYSYCSVQPVPLEKLLSWNYINMSVFAFSFTHAIVRILNEIFIIKYTTKSLPSKSKLHDYRKNIFQHYLDNFHPHQIIWSKSTPNKINIIWSKDDSNSILC